ncbi:MAG: sugar phosphate isomerase/epimerase [Clostridium sp.]|nr:sugar phosphate isomerase/epimerase [Clostridium sp.]
MKVAVTIAGSEAKASAFVVWRGFEESVRKAGAYGFDGVELALKDKSDIDEDRLARLLEANKIEVSCISTGQVFADRGMYFTHPDPEVRRRTIEVFSGLIGLASRFGKTVNIGRARGFIPEGKTRKDTEALFVETMREICDIAADSGVEMILEPVNRYEINFINNLDEGAALLEKVKRGNCGLQPDVFHMNIEDARMGESLVRHKKWIRYIHLADSNRYAPGMGHLDFEEVFGALKKIEYDGWASIEILPGNNPDSMAERAIRYLKPLVEAYNN